MYQLYKSKKQKRNGEFTFLKELILEIDIGHWYKSAHKLAV